MSKTHSPISPSNFERRMLCPGSLNAEKGLPYTTSVYAETGTMLHEMVNKYITDDYFITSLNLTEEQQNAVSNAGNYYLELKNSNLTVVKEIHEQTFSLDFLMPGMQGTADSEELVAAKVRLLGDEELGRIYENKDLIRTYLTSVEEYIKEKLETSEFLNYKLMPKMSNRKWRDGAESVLRDKLGEDAYEKKLIGIGKAEKLIGRDEVNRLTKKELGENQIVKVDYSISISRLNCPVIVVWISNFGE